MELRKRDLIFDVPPCNDSTLLFLSPLKAVGPLMDTRGKLTQKPYDFWPSCLYSDNCTIHFLGLPLYPSILVGLIVKFVSDTHAFRIFSLGSVPSLIDHL